MSNDIIDFDFWKDFLPKEQLRALQTANYTSNPAMTAVVREGFAKLKETILNAPGYWNCTDAETKDIKVILHYTSVDCDWYLATIGYYVENRDSEERPFDISFGYARLNNDFFNAELGSVSLRELISLPVVLDTTWDTNTTLQDVIDKNKQRIRA